MIKVIATSDTHGTLPKIEESFDLLLIGGDVAPNFGYGRIFDSEGQHNWFQTEFVPWVLGLPFADDQSKVAFIGGNHDFWLEQESDGFNEGGYSAIWPDVIIPCSNRLVYLYDSEYIFKKGNEYLKIYGTPWCKIFGTWAFMVDDKKLKMAFDNIPEGLDILLTHDAPAIPPYGIISQGRWAGEDAGNKVLAEAIKEKKPKYAFHGHIHSSSHTLTEVDGTKIAAVCLKDEGYRPVYEPLVLEIEGNKNEKTNENGKDIQN